MLSGDRVEALQSIFALIAATSASSWLTRSASSAADTRYPNRGLRLTVKAQSSSSDLSLSFPPIAIDVAPNLAPSARARVKFVVVTPFGTSFLKSIR